MPMRSPEDGTDRPGSSATGVFCDKSDYCEDAHDEAGELVELVGGLIELRPAMRDAGDAIVAQLRRLASETGEPALMELQLEQLSRQIRASWLRWVAAETAWVLRSPTEREASWLSGSHDTFGYERDLQPIGLEKRCDAFFDAVPPPWGSEHVMFSSGQAALLTVLLALNSPHPLRVRHLGNYFETRKLIQSCPSVCHLVDTDADVVIAELVASNGGFEYHSKGEIAAVVATAKALVLDTTLLGRADRIGNLLADIDRDILVLRCVSGLKLLQAGLELANVGIVGIYSRSDRGVAGFAEGLRQMRTLCGSGLRYADVLALEAPFVLDRHYADRYAAAVFAHNADLACSAEERNALFVSPVSAEPSPYCVFMLREPTNERYERLAALIEKEAAARKILFPRGGSFGFRGHRYEIVRPDDQPPFLRVAMGRRAGWSHRGICALMAEVAGRDTI